MRKPNDYWESWLDIEFLQNTVKSKKIQIGEYTYYAGFDDIYPFEQQCVRYLNDSTEGDNLYIGKFCSIGSGAIFNIGGSQRHRQDWISSYPFYYMFNEEVPDLCNPYKPLGDTVVGNDVWIGNEAMIMPNISIGDGAIIGARALVTKDVAPYSVVGGVPSKEIRKRYSEKIINLLLELSWWDLPINIIKELMPYLSNDNVNMVIEKGTELKKSL